MSVLVRIQDVVRGNHQVCRGSRQDLGFVIKFTCESEAHVNVRKELRKLVRSELTRLNSVVTLNFTQN